MSLTIDALHLNESADVPAGLRELYSGRRSRFINAIAGWKVDGPVVLTDNDALVLPIEAKPAVILYALLVNMCMAAARGDDAEDGEDGSEDVEPSAAQRQRRHTITTDCLAAAGIFTDARSAIACSAADVRTILQRVTVAGAAGVTLPPSFPVVTRLLVDAVALLQKDSALRTYWGRVMILAEAAGWPRLAVRPAEVKRFLSGELQILLVPSNRLREIFKAMAPHGKEELRCRRGWLRSDGANCVKYRCYRCGDGSAAAADDGDSDSDSGAKRQRVDNAASEAVPDASSASPTSAPDDADRERREGMAEAVNDDANSGETQYTRDCGCGRLLEVLAPLARDAPLALLRTVEREHSGHTPGDAADNALMAIPSPVERFIQNGVVGPDGSALVRPAGFLQQVQEYSKVATAQIDVNSQRVLLLNSAPVAILDEDGAAVVGSGGVRSRGGAHVWKRGERGAAQAAAIAAADASPALLAETICSCGVPEGSAGEGEDADTISCDNRPCVNGREFHPDCVGTTAEAHATLVANGQPWHCPTCTTSTDSTGVSARLVAADAAGVEASEVGEGGALAEAAATLAPSAATARRQRGGRLLQIDARGDSPAAPCCVWHVQFPVCALCGLAAPAAAGWRG